MIYTEQDLDIGVNAFDIINESAWVDGPSIISPDTIPMVESSDIGGVVVRFSDVEALSEEYGVDYIDSMLAIAESNNLDPQYMAVAVDESELIINPELIYELANVVVVPQSENSLAYQFCEACLDAYIDSGDEEYIDLICEDFYDHYQKGFQQGIDNAMYQAELMSNAITDDQQRFDHYLTFGTDENHPYISKYWSNKQMANKRFKNKYNKNKLKLGSKILSQGNLKKETEINNFLDKILKRADKMPKSWIGQKIAALRGLYLQYKDKWEMQKHIQPHKHNIFKTIADKILSVIDYLLEKLQNFAG